MKTISRIIGVFLFAIGLANESSADSRMNKVEGFKSIKVGRALQVYDEVVSICESEGVALQLCTNTTQDCIDCVAGIIIPIGFTFCSVSTEVDKFCESVQSCKNRCHQDCQDELQAATACMLKEGGCDVDQCSPGFKAGDLVALALGAVVHVWMLINYM